MAEQKKSPSFADHALEISEKASPGPWNLLIMDAAAAQVGEMKIIPLAKTIETNLANLGFTSASRELVPELARRLKIAIDKIERLGVASLDTKSYVALDKWIEETLEAMPREEEGKY